ncbi:MAG TPA: hypothetical protein VK639_18430, partial [Terriglobales bacterium]|nr:hypothetical protein [Terriglobales bacterium]
MASGRISPADQSPGAKVHARAARSTIAARLQDLMCVMLLAECALAAASTPPRCPAWSRPDIVLITLDTTRAD